MQRAALQRSVVASALALPLAFAARPAGAQTVRVDASTRYQTIDGFGTCLSGTEAQQKWWQNLYFDDLAASIVRVDITPTFKAPYSNLHYCSPWFGQPAPLTLDSGNNGPDGTRARRYTSAADYSTTFGGCSAPIAVMGPDIDKNVAFFDFTGAQAVPGLVAQLGKAKASALGGFKLYASMWSPAPWVKIASGNTYGGSASPLPTSIAWPFIWGGNFAGGKIDVSGTPLSQFDDGTGPTSALTQFARGLAAFLRGFQTTFGVSFYAISIQNELNFEEYYNSATYPLTAEYIAALKAARAELDAHADLKDIKIIGPEDLMGGDAYGMWQYGSGSGEVDKNLHYLQDIAADSAASAAIAGFAIHGYGADGTSSAGASSQLWAWWAGGWSASPAAGIPGNVKGFSAFSKPSWMTETSGENVEWLSSSMGGGFPDYGGFSIAIKIHQALTTGSESAWLYWQLTDGSPAADGSNVQTLTDATQLASCPKYVAAKHFFRSIRPGSRRVAADVSGTGATSLLASAYLLEATASLTVVLVNESTSTANVELDLSAAPSGLTSMSAYTSSNGAYWQTSTVKVARAKASVTVPGYGVVTLTGAGQPPPSPDSGADGGHAGRDAGPGHDASSGGGGAGGTGGSGASPGPSSGCGCSSAPSGPGTQAGLMAAAVAACLIGRRRRGPRPSARG